MPHDAALIALIVVGFGCALVGGLCAARVGLPPLAGYLLAGIVVGPFTPGFSGDPLLAHQLAEIGVVLLLFGVGMHVSLKDLLAVRWVALPGAVIAFGLANLIVTGAGFAFGWGLGAAVVLSLSLTITSTVVLLRTLDAFGLTLSPIGQLAIGWLVVEDMLTVLLLVALPAFSGLLGGSASAGGGVWLTLALTLGKVAAFVAVMLAFGARALPWFLAFVARTGSRELFTLAAMMIALGISFGASSFLGLSPALGAFFAGIVLNGTDHSHRAQTDTEPLQDMFAVMFFVSVGMLVDPAILVRDPLGVLMALGVIFLIKPALAFCLLLLFRQSRAAALTIAIGLAQIGEFSFILAGLGTELHLLPHAGQDLILAAALLAITLNPLLFRVARQLVP